MIGRVAISRPPSPITPTLSSKECLCPSPCRGRPHRGQRLAKAAIVFLSRCAPDPRALASSRAPSENSFQRPQYAASSRKYINAPRPTRTIIRLNLEQEVHRALNRGCLPGLQSAEAFDPRRAVTSAVEYRHRLLSANECLHKAFDHCRDQTRPASIAEFCMLSSHWMPASRASKALGRGYFTSCSATAQRRVVARARIKASNSKAQPPGSASFLDLPVARTKHLLRKHPLRGLHQRRMIGGQPLLPARHRDAGVQHRRHAWLHAKGVSPVPSTPNPPPAPPHPR